MPALKIFGRRWLISSDDVPVPAFFLTLFRVVRGFRTGLLPGLAWVGAKVRRR